MKSKPQVAPVRRAKPRPLWPYRLGLPVLLAVLALLPGLGQADAPGQAHLPLVARSLERPGRLLISEVLVDAEGQEPEGEWIELYNPGAASYEWVELLLGDAETPGDTEGVYRFPASGALGPGKTLLIAFRAANFLAQYGFLPDYELLDSDPSVPDLVRDPAWAAGRLELVNGGDEVLLVGAGGLPVDAVSWGSSTSALDPAARRAPEGHSLERYPPDRDTNTAADWRAQPDPAPGQVDFRLPTLTATPTPTRAPTSTPSPTPTVYRTPTPGLSGPLLLSEVFADPPGDADPAGEWVEVYNPGPADVPLDAFRLGDEETQGGSEGMAWFPPWSVLAPGQTAVVAQQAALFRQAYGFPPDFEWADSDPDVPDMIPDPGAQTGAPLLSNAGDEVLLLGPANRLADAVSWGSSDWAFSPPVPAARDGRSLERWPPNADSDTAADWREQSTPSPGQALLPAPTPTPPPTPALGRLLVSEVLYSIDAEGAEPAGEWIELVNGGGAMLDIGGWKIGDEAQRGGDEGMFQFPPGAALEPGEFLVVANQAVMFYEQYQFRPDFEIVETDPSVPNLTPYRAWGLGELILNNAGEEVLALDTGDRLVDALSWGSSVWAFNPSLPLCPQDSSLERTPPRLDTDRSADWICQPNPSPGAG